MCKTVYVLLFTAILLISGKGHSHGSILHSPKASKQGKQSEVIEPPWLTHKQIESNIWVINDNQQDNIYLVEGEKYALVIDTGLGYQNLKTYAKSLTSKPLVVVNSHAHPDHAGGNHVFEHVHIHEDELETLAFYTSEPVMEDTYKRFAQIPMPDHLRDQNKSTATMLKIEEGFQFDLGGRVLDVIHIPGHSPGSIALYDSQSKNMFTGDMTAQHVWLQVKYAMPVETFLSSIRKLLDRKDSINALLPGHGGPLPPDHLNTLAAAAKKLIAGDCEVTPYESPLGWADSCHHQGVVIVYNQTALDKPGIKP